MFTPDDRERLRAELLERARADPRIQAGAITGSAAAGREDRWSDIDLAFGVAGASSVDEVVRDFTGLMYGDHEAVHHLDLLAGATLYRVFLLPTTLQVDLAFSPAGEFGARGATFKQVFGAAAASFPVPEPPLEHWVGWAWLYALHARSCIQRAEWWRAEYMVSGMRDTVLSLACARRGLPAHQARGADRLPAAVLKPLERALVKNLTPAATVRAFRAAVDMCLTEVGAADPALRARIEGPLVHMVEGG